MTVVRSGMFVRIDFLFTYPNLKCPYYAVLPLFWSLLY